MRKLIIHIPPSSVNIPFFDGYCLDKQSLFEEQVLLTDWYTDDIFHTQEDPIVKADFSRIFCDVERFEDDKLEPMAKFGMGVLYTATDEGKLMRNVSPEYRAKVINQYYKKHHLKLTSEVEKQLQINGNACIVDAHSFADIPFNRDLEKSTNRPDFNIGTDSFHTPQILVDISVDFFEKHKHTIWLDKPYSGSIVPLEYYKKNPKVNSIMLEVNRKMYLKDNSNIKSDNYNYTKDLVWEYLDLIRNTIG